MKTGLKKSQKTTEIFFDEASVLRKQLKMNKAIEERSVKIQKKTDMFYANEIAAKQAEQQKIRERQRGGWER